jgi:hypothetical protein
MATIADQVSSADTALVELCHAGVSDVISHMVQFDPEIIFIALRVSREWYWGCMAYLRSTNIIARAAQLHTTRKLWLNDAPTTVRGALMAIRLHERRTFNWYYARIRTDNMPIRDCLAMLLGNPQQSFEECYRLAYGITLHKHLTPDNFEPLMREYYAVGTHDKDQVKMCAGFLMYSFRTICNKDSNASEAWVMTLL